MNEIIINEVIVVVVALCFLLLVGIIIWLIFLKSCSKVIVIKVL